MKQRMNSRSLAAIIFCISLLMSGCALTKAKTAPTDARTQNLIAGIESQNKHIRTFNGQGSISIKEPSKTSSYRLAWAGEYPDKIRLIVLFSGKPVETVAADGNFLYLKSHNNAHRLIRRERKNPSLEPFIALPLTTGQITNYLSGRVPVPAYERAQIEPSGKGNVLSFYRNGNEVIQQVFLDENNKVNTYEIMESASTLFRISLKQSDSDEALRFPSMIEVAQGQRSCIITIENSTPNPRLAEDTFKITP